MVYDYLDRQREKRRQGRRDSFNKRQGAKALDMAEMVVPSTTEEVAVPIQLNEAKDQSTESVSSYDQNNWRDGAACSPRNNPDVDPEIFFGADDKKAKRICGGCAVRVFCLEYAVTNREGYGTWGGLTEKQLSKAVRGMAIGLKNRR